MATPRKKWFRVADSLTQKPLSNDELATLIRLMGQLNQRWARDGLTADEACSILLRPGDLMACTGSGTLVRARSIARGLAIVVQCTVDEDGVNTLIKLPKWASFQRLPSESGAISGQKLPPPQDARRKTQDAPAKRKSVRAKRAPACVCPEALSPDDRERVRAWASEQTPPIEAAHLGPAWLVLRDWAIGQDHRRVDWVAVFRNALTDGWALKGSGPSGDKLSPAQAKAERTNEAARESLRNFQKRNGSTGRVISIAGGQTDG